MRILTWLSMASELLTHIGSEQNMLQLYQNSMAICCAFCKPDIFLTMTANPNWVEIQEALLKEPTVDGYLYLYIVRKVMTNR